MYHIISKNGCLKKNIDLRHLYSFIIFIRVLAHLIILDIVQKIIELRPLFNSPWVEGSNFCNHDYYKKG